MNFKRSLVFTANLNYNNWKRILFSLGKYELIDFKTENFLNKNTTFVTATRPDQTVVTFAFDDFGVVNFSISGIKALDQNSEKELLYIFPNFAKLSHALLQENFKKFGKIYAQKFLNKTRSSISKTNAQIQLITKQKNHYQNLLYEIESLPKSNDFSDFVFDLISKKSKELDQNLNYAAHLESIHELATELVTGETFIRVYTENITKLALLRESAERYAKYNKKQKHKQLQTLSNSTPQDEPESQS